MQDLKECLLSLCKYMTFYPHHKIFPIKIQALCKTNTVRHVFYSSSQPCNSLEGRKQLCFINISIFKILYIWKSRNRFLNTDMMLTSTCERRTWSWNRACFAWKHSRNEPETPSWRSKKAASRHAKHGIQERQTWPFAQQKAMSGKAAKGKATGI